MAYPDSYTQLDVSNAGRIYLWFKAPPGTYTVKIAWRVELDASGPHGRANLTLNDKANNINIVNHFITTNGSPWSANGTYDLVVTTTDQVEHVILDYNPTLNFANESPEHADTGTAKANLTIKSVTKN